MDRVVSLGCIACLIDGHVTPEVSIHHTAGRVAFGCHVKTIALCAGHHQDGSGAAGMLARHPYKARFAERYGSDAFLVALTDELLKFLDKVPLRGVSIDRFIWYAARELHARFGSPQNEDDETRNISGDL